MHNEKKDINKVIVCYTGAIKFKKDEPILYLYRGYAKTFVQDYTGAISDFDSVINSKTIRYETNFRGMAFKNRAEVRTLLGIYFKDTPLLFSAIKDIDSVLSYEQFDKAELLIARDKLTKNIAQIENNEKE